MKVDEGEGDLLPGLSAAEKHGSLDLRFVEPVQGFAEYSRLDSLAIIQIKIKLLFIHQVTE